MMNTIKSCGTSKDVMRKWTLFELVQKHENNVERYERTVKDLIRKMILNNKGFIAGYVLKIESRERDMIDKYDLVVLSRVHAENLFSADLEDKEPIVGTHYIIGRRDEKYDPIDIFM